MLKVSGSKTGISFLECYKEKLNFFCFLILKVFVDPLTVIDMEFIASTLFPAIDKTIIKKMVVFNNQVGTHSFYLFFIVLSVQDYSLNVVLCQIKVYFE